MDKLVRAKQKYLSDKRGKPVSYGEAYSEVIADSMEAMLADGNVIEKIMKLKAKDSDLVAKIKQFFDNLLAKIRNIYNGLTPDSAEGKAVLEMKDSIEKIQQLFAEALVDASENFQSAPVEKNTTEDGGVKYQFKGYAEDGRGIYESNFPKGTPKKAKAARILSLIQDVWSQKPITLKIEDENGTKYITAKFDPTYDETGRNTDASKLMGGNRHGTSSEQRVTLDLADDYYQIAEESTYNYSKEETGKDSDTHKDVRYWHYFINDIYFAEYGSKELVPYRVSINVKEKSDGNFFYSFSAEKAEEISTQRTLHAAVSNSNETATNGDLFDTTLTPKGDFVKNESAESLDVEVDADTESVAHAVLKSERNNPYSYETLISKQDMVVTTVDGNVPKNRADVVYQAKQNAAKVGKFDPKTGSVSVHVEDIDADVIIGRDGLKHSLDRRFDVNAPVVLKVGEILANSIRINELTPQKAEAAESYVLIGMAKNDSDDLYIVRSVVNRFSNELTSMDVLYAINAKKEPAALLPLFTDKTALGTDSTISIASLLDYVNEYFPDILPEDILKHYGHDSRPEGKLGESALYQDRADESVSNRSLLANALESAVKDDTEKQKILEYKGKVTEFK